MAYIVVTVDGNEVARRAVLDALTIGRSTDCDVAIIDRRVSRQHCRIERVDGSWRVVDLNSHNGTYVHGRRMSESFLHDGDSFEVGHAKVRFHEVGWVPGRPADPGQKPPPSMMDSAITAAPPPPPVATPRHTKARLATVAKPTERHPGHHPRRGAKPLPFTRPPARPIVDPTKAHRSDGGDEEAEPETTRSLLGRWLKR